MAIYKRDVTDAEDDIQPTIQACYKLNLFFIAVTHGCAAYIELCELTDFTRNEDGEIILTHDIILTTNPECATFFSDKQLKILSGAKLNKVKLDNFSIGGASVEVRLETTTGDLIETQTVNVTLEKDFHFANQNLMPKLAEWHIYGNEQQGRFVTRKPEAEPLYYLANLTTDVKNKNFFRILDKKEYELKDHLGNVRVAIGDMKLPENEATSTRGIPPFLTDEKAVNDYHK